MPQTIVRSSRIGGPLQFGFEMGTGVRTFVPTALPMSLVLLVLLWTSDLRTALLAGLGFGLGRALLRPARPTDPLAWDAALAAHRRLFSAATTLAFAGITVILIV